MTDPGHISYPAVILSGGRSSRMGESKAMLALGDARLVDHVAARIRPQVSKVFLNANDPAIALARADAFPDSFSGFQGPLAGIHAGLAHVRNALPGVSHAFMLPVDCPFFPEDIVARLAESLTGADDLALAASGGRMHPVLGLWPILLADRLAAWLADPPTLKVRAFLDDKPVHITEYPMIETAFGPLDPFFNVNTPADLDRARKIMDVGLKGQDEKPESWL